MDKSTKSSDNITSINTTENDSLDSLAQPSYRKSQEQSAMTNQIKLYIKNVSSEVIGPKHGIRPEDISKLAGKIKEITDAMSQDREDGKLPYRDLPFQHKNCLKIKELADKLRGRYDNLVVLGIGGSALGNIALQTALNSPIHNLLDQQNRQGPRLFIIDNVDPDQFRTLLDFLENQLDRTLFNVISKSGRTAETASQYLTVAELIRKKIPNANLSDHIIATTDPKKGTLRSIANEQGLTTLEVPDGVGGRFSVLSDVGLFSAAMCGIDIEELLAGAADMDKRVKSDEIEKNPAAMYAAIQYILYNKDKPLSVMMPYSYRLKDLSDWFRQLWAESLGKRENLAGKVVHIGPTPINALGTTDQHSQVQLYREGPNDKIFTFLEIEQYDHEVVLGNSGSITELEYLSGRKMSDLIKAEKQATEYALLQSQRPCLTIKFPQISAHTVGQFIYLFEVAASYMGGLFQINPYDQPAVELGKEATFALMDHKDYRDLLEKIDPVRQIDDHFLI